MVDTGDPLVRAQGLTKHFPLSSGFMARLLERDRRVVHAVEDVTLDVRRGETYGLVGESGCGKTTLGRLLLRLVEPTSGTITFDGREITRLPEPELRPLRRRMQLVFQDPHASLNPAMTVGEAVMHPLLIHGLAESRDAARERAWRVFDEVGLSPVENFFDKRPADLSGGQKQRVVIARAVVTEPDFIVADEPVSMLDMSVRAKILELLIRLKEKYRITLVFITHDLATARFLCDRVAIMYLGQIVEEAPARELFQRPEMPYTQALLRAIPVPDPTARRAEALAKGEVPDAVHPPAGCRFHPRCPVATGNCGFTARDVLGAADERLTRLDEAARARSTALLGAPAAWSADGTTLRVPLAGDRTTARAELEATLEAGGDGLRAAVTSVTEEGQMLTVTFREPRPIHVRHRDARRVLCLLYADGEHRVNEP